MQAKSADKPDLASVSFKSIAQFYDGDDPSPEESRWLSERAEDWILRAVIDVPKGYPGGSFNKLELEFPAEEILPGREQSIIAATKGHFKRRAPEFERERRLTWKVGIREFRLTIAVCIPAFAGIAVLSQFHGNPVAEVVENVLVIFSWVVIWQPFQSLVFDRWMQGISARVCRHIAEMEITIRIPDPVKKNTG